MKNCPVCQAPVIDKSTRGRRRVYCSQACLINHNNSRRVDFRAQVVELLGGACVDCGETEGLEISHNNRDGKMERKYVQETTFLRRILRGSRPTEDLSLRCHECHFIYDFEPKDFCDSGHELIGDNLYIAPGGGKYCRECHRVQWQVWKKANRGKVNDYYRSRIK